MEISDSMKYPRRMDWMENLFNLEELPELSELISSLEKYKILSTLPFEKVDFWNSCVTTVESKPIHNVGALKNLKLSLLRIAKILSEFLRGDYDAVLITGGEKSDLIYLAMVRCLFWKNIPHIIVGAEWNIPSSKTKLFLQKLYFHFVKKLILEIQVYSREEISIYSRSLSIPEDKFKRIPFSTTLIGYDFSPSNMGFILSGGSSFRDYKTFIEAAKKIPYPVEIGIPAGFPLNFGNLVGTSDNIKIHYGLPRTEFLKKTTQCKIMALPIVPNLKRSVGDQSILNAMFYGKIVVATSSIGSRNYIVDGVNGFLVKESDPESWVETIDKVFKMNADEFERISSNAIYTAKEIFSEKNMLMRILHSLRDNLNINDHLICPPL